MSSQENFKAYCTRHFERLCHGYDYALDDTLVRAWAPGHKTQADAGGAWDMSTRFFPALCSWLSQPDRPRSFKVRGRTLDLEKLTRGILINAFDPEKHGYWGREEFPPRNQRTVESSMLAYGAWLVRDHLLPTIPEHAIHCFQKWLAYFASDELVRGNWNLFWIVNHAARKALGWEYDQQTIEKAWTIIEACDRGDGWLCDGHDGYFDDYNWWVFGTHELFWEQMDGAGNPELCERINGRLKQRLEQYPYFFGRDGSYSEYGRSLSYKFARLGCPLLAYQQGLWPHSPGMLKRLVRRHLAFYEDNGAITRPEGLVSQTLSEFGHPAVRDGYINTGHPYWCMHAFVALWQLPDDDPLWSAEEEPLPVEKGSFQKVIKPAGWILSGSEETGCVHRYSLGTQHGVGSSAAKYGKFQYSTHFPVNFGSVEGDFGPDATLCLTDGDHWAHPGVFHPFLAEADFLRARYVLNVGEQDIAVETILIPEEEGCFRLHRLALPAGVTHLTVWEGGSAAGYAPADSVAKSVKKDPLSSFVQTAGLTSWIVGLEGYTRAHSARGFRGNEHLNGIHDRAVTPLLEANLEETKTGFHTLACWTLAARRKIQEPLIPPTFKYNWKKDGSVEVSMANRELTVPALKGKQ